MTRILLLFLLVSCNHLLLPEDGANGLNGIPGKDGGNYYSYGVNVNLQEIVGDGVMEEFIVDSGNFYELPKSMELMVDNTYPDCQLQDATIILETDSKKYRYIFKEGSNRYYMRLKSAPESAVVASKSLKVYYESHPKTKCSEGQYELHSGLNFNMKVIEELAAK